MKAGRLPWIVSVIVLVCGCHERGPASTAALAGPDLSLVTEERLVQAVQRARKAVIEAPQSSAAWGALGHVYMVHGWEVEASSCYRRAVEIEPGEFRWHYFLGRSLEGTDPASASDALAGALERDGAYAPALHAQARVLRSLGRTEEARAHLARAVQRVPEDALAELGLGELALGDGNLEAAREHLERALELEPGRSEAHRVLAQVHAALGNRQKAESHAEAGLEPGPESSLHDPLWSEVERAGVTKFWHAKRAYRYLRENRYDRAVNEFYQIADDREKNPMFWYNFGNALRNTGRKDKAVEIYEKALAALEDPDYAGRIESEQAEKIYNNLCIARAGNRALDAAERCFRDARELYPASEAILTNLAILYYRQARLEEAIELLEQSPLTSASSSLKQLLDRMVAELGTARGSG